jgi:hypothetical protein
MERHNSFNIRYLKLTVTKPSNGADGAIVNLKPALYLLSMWL